MRPRLHTIVFIPRSRGRTRQFHVRTRWLWAGALGGALLLGASGWILVSESAAVLKARDLARMERENEDLRHMNESLETSVSRLQTALNDAEDRTRDLAIVAGLDQAIGGEPENRLSESGAGGGYSRPGGHDLPLLQARAGLLDRQLQAVDDALQERRLALRSTPMVWPVRGVINSGFGFRQDPITGQRSRHLGIDISAERGQPVTATADGLVVRAERIGNLGRAVYVSHRFGYQTRYGHMSKILVEEGSEVRRGDLLGYVGNSGRATGYHLHYEVRRSGAAHDPVDYLRD